LTGNTELIYALGVERLDTDCIPSGSSLNACRAARHADTPIIILEHRATACVPWCVACVPLCQHLHYSNLDCCPQLF